MGGEPGGGWRAGIEKVVGLGPSDGMQVEGDGGEAVEDGFAA